MCVEGGFPGGSVVKNLLANSGDARDISCAFNPWFRKIPWRRKWQPNSSILVWRILVGYSPWGHKELDMTEQLSRHAVVYVWSKIDIGKHCTFRSVYCLAKTALLLCKNKKSQ